VLASATGVTVGGTSTTTVALGTNSTALSTTTVGGAITGNILRINSAAAGTATFTTNNASNLVINTNSGTTTGNITLNTGTNGNIAITPNGTGSVLVGDQSAAGTVTTGTITANLTLNTNNGTTSGSVVLTAGANGAIVVTTNGSGAVQLVTSTTQLGVLNTATTLTTNGTSNLTINTNNGTNAGNIVLNNGVNGNITAVPNGTGKIGFFTTNPVSKFTVVSAGGTVPTIAFPDATNTRYNTGIGSRQVTNIGQILDLYSGDSTVNGTDLNSGHIRQTIMPNGFVGISQTQPNALLHINNSRIIGAGFNLSTVSAMDAALDTITFSAIHNLNTGDIVFYIPGSGGAIGGIFGSTANPGWQYFYYAQVIDTVTIKLHPTGYGAHAQGTAVDLTGTLPSGTHTFRKGTEWTQLAGNNGNGTTLHTYHYRHTDGADWTGTSTRIQQRIDITPQGYIEFNATGGVSDVAFGAGSPGGEVFRISGTSLVLGIGNTHTAAVGRTIRMTNMSGTDISAGTMSIQGALSTGAATGGAIRFLTGTTTTSGATLQTAHERLSIDTASASTILNLSTPATTANLFTANATTINIGSANSGRVAVAFNQTSTSTTTGALTVTGGVGISGNLNVGQTVLTNRFLSSPYQPVVPRSPVYRGTGALVEITTTIFVGETPRTVAIDPTGRFVYVTIESGTISQYSINQTTGALTSITAPIAASGGLSAAIDPTGRFVYVVNFSSSSISQYSINQTTGALTSIAGIASGTFPVAVAVDPTGRFVYVANSGAASVSQYSINQTTGALTSITTAIAAGSSPQGVAVDPTGRFVYVANSGAASVSQYSIDQTSGALTSITTAIATFGTARRIAVDPTGRFVYVAQESSSTVGQYSINQTTGALTQITTSIAAGSTPYGVAVDPTGRFVYVSSNVESGTISQYSINQTTGALTSITSAISTGNRPTDLAVDPTGRFVYVVNQGNFGAGSPGSFVSLFSINNFSAGQSIISSSAPATNAQTGALQVVGGVGIGGNLHVGGTITGNFSVYDLDDVSASVTGLENTFALTFNQTAVAIANPFSVMVTVNGIIQPGFIYNYNAVYGGLLWTSFKGYTIVGGNIKFADSPEPGSEIMIRNTGMTSNFTTPKRYPIKPAEIMLGM
jgi:6-phosphogluconolactonase (cycloisomerase 2 family)